MPAITTTTVAGTPLDKILQDVVETKPTDWNYFFERPHLMKEIFKELANTPSSTNFFSEDYSINSFFTFLKAFVKYPSIKRAKLDSDDLSNLNAVLSNCKKTILEQRQLNQKEIDIITQYANFINIFFQGPYRYWLVDDHLKFKMNDLSEIAIHVAKNNNASLVDFIYSYVSTLKLSFDIKKFMLDYQKEDVACFSIVSIGKILFLQTDKKINRVIPHLFSNLAYEYKLITHYKVLFGLSSYEDWQEEIIKEAMALQDNFFVNLHKRNDVRKEGLKYYFFKYFIKQAEIASPLKELYANVFPFYSNEHYTPLPLTSECPSSGSNQFIIEHDGVDQDKLEIICQAKACAERNHGEWLQRLGIDQTQLPANHYTYRVFNETRFDDDLNFFTTYGPPSSGFYMSSYRNLSKAEGIAYVQYRPDLTSWWEVSGHEYAHHLNFVAFGNIHRNFDEGLAYRVILSACGDSSYRRWLEVNHNNYTSLAKLQSQGFIGYNPSFLFMSYMVDNNLPLFSEILQSYRTYDNFTLDKIKQLTSHDSHFISWMAANREYCKGFILGKLGEGDGYCPTLLSNDLETNAYQNIFGTTRNMPLPTTSQSSNVGPALFPARKLTLDEMGHNLIFKISEGKFDEFRILLENGANPNFFEENTGNTPLHFLYFYGNCNVQYLELLLEYHPKIIRNHEGQFPLEMAEKRCNAMDLLKIQEAFSRYARQQKLLLTITIPIASFVNGVISGWSEEMAQRNSKSRYIPNIIFYGVKPVTLAISNSAINILLGGSAEAIGLDDIGLSFTYYLVMNYLGLMLAQFGERITNKCKNKFLSIVMSISLYAFFLNPSLLVLLLTEGLIATNFQSILQPLLSLLSGGIFFKAGEYSVQKAYEKFFPINSADIVNSHPDYFLSYSSDKSPKEISADEKVLTEIKEKLFQLTLSIKKHINKQVYQLNFKEDLQSASEAISILIEKIHKESKGLVEYKAEFTALEKSLNNIQSALTQLNQCSSETKIQSLWNATTQLLTNLRGIRPLPQTNKVPDVLPQPEPIKEEQTMPLMVSFSNPKESQPKICNRYTRPPTIFGRMKNVFFIRPSEAGSGFPKPPTEQELQEMGIFNEKSNENLRKVYQNRG